MQGLIKTRPVNFIIGARYDKHNVYGDAFVPRVGLTKKIGAFHFKALYSNSFRAPSIENVNGSSDSLGIKPELTQVAELELGYKLGRRSIISVNLFDITTKDPIVYKTDANNADLYVNEGGSGTQGVEAEYKYRANKFSVAVNYAFYSAAKKKQIADYSVSEDTSALLAFAKHRVNFSAIWNATEKLSVNLNASVYGRRWAYTSVDTLGTSVLEKLSPTVLLNLFINWEPVEGLNLGLGCYDMLNQKFQFIQPYNGYHPPLPGPSREIIFKLQYNLHFKSANKKAVK